MNKTLFEAKFRNAPNMINFGDLIQNLANIYTSSEPYISLEVGETGLTFLYSGRYSDHIDEDAYYKTKMSARFDKHNFEFDRFDKDYTGIPIYHLHESPPLRFRVEFAPFFKLPLNTPHPRFPLDQDQIHSFLIEQREDKFFLRVEAGGEELSLPLMPALSPTPYPVYPTSVKILDDVLVGFVEYALKNKYRRISFLLERSEKEGSRVTLRCEAKMEVEVRYAETHTFATPYLFDSLPYALQDVPLKDRGDYFGEFRDEYPLALFEPILRPMGEVDTFHVWMNPGNPLILQKGLSTYIRQWIPPVDRD